ncbi:MAG: preprotein translocase subunit YajC [Deltaproteobacteria bacterium]
MSFTIIIWIVVFFGIFYFLAIRPQRRQRQQHSEMISMLKKGDEVVTIGGMYGTVSAIGDEWVELEIAKRTRVRYLKRAISSITSIDEYDEDDEDEYIEAADDEVIEEADEDVVVDEEEVIEEADVADDTVDDVADETPDAPDTPEAPKA